VTPHYHFSRSNPRQQGVDEAGVAALLDALESDSRIEMHSLMVVRHGSVIAEGWWRPYSPGRLHLLYSLSKTFTATALGIAVAEDRVDLDATMLHYLPELTAVEPSDRTQRIRVRDLASMASGHHAETFGQVYPTADWMAAFAAMPPESEPGTVFAYNQSCTYAIAKILQRVTGQGLVDYLRPRLLDPIGAGPVSWKTSPEGVALGFSGLHATTETVARLGHLYLRRGMWGRRRVLTEEWVDEATRRQVATTNDKFPDWDMGYGFQIWMSRHGYRGDGAHGQLMMVLPELDAVIVTTAATPAMDAIVEATWEHLLPAFDRPPTHAHTPGRTAGRLDSLRIGHSTLSPQPTDPSLWRDAVRAPAEGVQDLVEHIDQLRLQEAGQTWYLDLVDDAGLSLRAPIAQGWPVFEAKVGDKSVPVAVHGGWRGDGRLEVSIRLVETPHTFTVSTGHDDSTFAATWGIAPLRAHHLSDLAADLPAGGPGDRSVASTGMTRSDLPRATPSRVGVDGSGIVGFLDALTDNELHSLMIVRDGAVVAEHFWDPYTSTDRHVLYSLGKLITATAVGAAVSDGLLDMDARLVDLFPAAADSARGDFAHRVTVRDVATMTSGHDVECWSQVSSQKDWVRAFLTEPIVHEPGSKFVYNQACTLVLADIVRRVTGREADDYLEARVLAPIGAERVTCEEVPAGVDAGARLSHATTEAALRVGMLYLNEGLWGEDRILASEWVREATSAQVSTAEHHAPAWRHGYGYQIWVAEQGYRGDGACSQFVAVLPEQRAVVASTGFTNIETVIQAMFEHLVPALGAGGSDLADRAAADRLANERVRIEHRADAGPDVVSAPAWAGVLLSPTARSVELLPGLTRMRVAHQGSRWVLGVEYEGEWLHAPFTPDAWGRDDALNGGEEQRLAVAGQWRDSRLLLSLGMLWAGYTLTVTADADAGTFEVHQRAR